MNLLINIIFFPMFTVFFLFLRMKVFQNKYKANIAFFALCEITLGLNMMVILKLLPLFQTDTISIIAYNLLLFLLISYMAMNIGNHLQFFYWNIYPVSVNAINRIKKTTSEK